MFDEMNKMINHFHHGFEDHSNSFGHGGKNKLSHKLDKYGKPIMEKYESNAYIKAGKKNNEKQQYYQNTGNKFNYERAENDRVSGNQVSKEYDDYEGSPIANEHSRKFEMEDANKYEDSPVRHSNVQTYNDIGPTQGSYKPVPKKPTIAPRKEAYPISKKLIRKD